VFGRLAGYEDVNDAERLCHDPAMRWVVGDRAIVDAAASASQMGRGHTSLIGGVDADLLVKKEDGGLICASVENMRDGPDGAEIYNRLGTVQVGTDDNGDPIFSCVAIQAEAPAAAQKAKARANKPLSPMAHKFWDAFNNAGTEHAAPRATSNNRPSITEVQWLTELERRGLLPNVPHDADKAAIRSINSRRRALVSKYRAELVAANWLACNGPVIWSTKERE